MTAKKSAGLLIYRVRSGRLQVLLVHPGGPFWAKKDLGVWSIPKGEFTAEEEPLQAAVREVFEETGLRIGGEFHRLDPVRQPGGKIVHAWAIEADCDASAIKSNKFTVEWPARSGTIREFPEVDRADWIEMETARRKILKGQVPLIDQLARLVADRGSTATKLKDA